MERASLRETQDTGCKGGPRQGVFVVVVVVVKPYQEYRRSISLLALRKKKREREGEEERERAKESLRSRYRQFFLISLKNSLSFAAAVRY